MEGAACRTHRSSDLLHVPFPQSLQKQSCCSGWRGCRGQVSCTPFPQVFYFIFHASSKTVCVGRLSSGRGSWGDGTEKGAALKLCVAAVLRCQQGFCTPCYLEKTHFLDFERKMSFSTLVILVCTAKPLQRQRSAHKMDEGEFWISLVWVQGVFVHHTQSPISFCFARNMLSMLIYAAVFKAAFPQRRVNSCWGCCCWNLEVEQMFGMLLLEFRGLDFSSSAQDAVNALHKRAAALGVSLLPQVLVPIMIRQFRLGQHPGGDKRHDPAALFVSVLQPEVTGMCHLTQTPRLVLTKQNPGVPVPPGFLKGWDRLLFFDFLEAMCQAGT